MLIRWSHHRQQHLKQTARRLHRFMAGPAWKFSAGVTRRFLHWWRQLTVWQRLTLAGGVAVVLFLILPNLKAGLKVLGFLEKDFIVSTSGARFETNRESYFNALVGEAADEKKVTLAMRAGNGQFRLTLLAPEPTATPTLTLTPTVTASTDSGQATSASPSAVPPGYQAAYEELAQAQVGLASVSASLATISSQLEELSSQVQQVSADVASALGTTDQSFLGPFETIKQRQVLGGKGDVTYYLDRHTLVETWQINQPIGDVLPFLFASEELSLRVSQDQLWELTDGERIGLRIETTLVSQDGQKSPLPPTRETVLSKSASGVTVSLELPAEWVNDPTKYPLQIVRRFSVPSEAEQAPAAYLTDLVGEELAGASTIVGPQPQYLAKMSDYLIVGDTKEQNVIAVAGNNLYSLLFNKEIVGLACGTSGCVLAEPNRLVLFVPLELINAESDLDKEMLMEKETIDSGPVGGVAMAGEAIYRTRNQGPLGILYKRDGFAHLEEMVAEDLAVAQMLTVNQAGTRYALWADGLLLLGEKNLPWQKISLGPKLLSLAIGSDDNIYFVTDLEKFNTNAVVRLTRGGGLEILKGITGKLVSVLPDAKALYVGMNLTEQAGAVVPIPWEKATWVPWDEYD